MASDGRSNRIGKLWQHAGSFCLVLETDLGSRNGYVRIPDDHPWHKLLMEMDPDPPTDWTKISESINEELKPSVPFPVPSPETQAVMNDYDRRRSSTWYDWMSGRIDVHGGWTFADLLTKEDFDRWVDGEGDGIPPGLWFGFDTAHFMDLRDVDLIRELSSPDTLKWKLEFAETTNGSPYPGSRIWSVDDVAAEISRAAEELAAAKILSEVGT